MDFWMEGGIVSDPSLTLYLYTHYTYPQVKHHVINPLAKDLTSLATAEAKREINWLRDQYLGGSGSGGVGGGGGGGAGSSVVV